MYRIQRDLSAYMRLGSETYKLACLFCSKVAVMLLGYEGLFGVDEVIGKSCLVE